MKIILMMAFLGSCPLGPGESELTVSRVMRNFGRGTMAAEKVARAAGSESSVSSSELQEAVAGTKMAEACASAVLDDPAQKLLPSKADELTGQDREKYLAKYYGHMREFAASLEGLEALLRTSLEAAPEARDFHAIATQVTEVRECATRAHGDL